jgi:putative endonuclease
MFFVYVLFSPTYQKIYIGFSEDVEKRVASHNDPRNSGWTRNFQPWTVVYTEEFLTKTDALKREKQLKTAGGRNFIHKEIIANL